MNLNTFSKGLIRDKKGDQKQSLPPQIPSQLTGSRKSFFFKVEDNSVEESYRENHLSCIGSMFSEPYIYIHTHQKGSRI